MVRTGLRRQRQDDRRRRSPGPSASSTSTPTTASSRWPWRPAAPNFCREDVVRYDWELAKELGLNITVHVAMDRFGYTKMQVERARGHGPALSEHDVRPRHRTAPPRSGTWSATRAATSRSRPQIELQMGHGWAPAVTAMDYDIPIGLSSDVATTASSDQFTQMHAIFGSERAATHQDRLGREPRVERAREQAHHLAAGPGDGRPSAAPRSPGSPTATGSLTPGQEGRRRDHRRRRGERRAGHRSGRRRSSARPTSRTSRR